ncbi:MAG: ATP-binding protein [Thermodesulfovibrionales bacterium]|nr:ATP-binding protein [Thermodesulfovibrionales bacterium]
MNKKKNTIIIFILFILIALSISALSIRLLDRATTELNTRIIITGILIFNIISITILIFFTVRNLYKLHSERQKNVLGHRFKTKLTVIFVTLAFIPSCLLFIFASGLSTNIMSRIFSPYITEHFKISTDMARGFYDLFRTELMALSEHVAKTERMPTFPNIKVYKVKDDRVSSELILNGLKGQKGSEVITDEKGDIIRAVCPSKDGGVIVAEYRIPLELSKSAESLRALNEEYLKVVRFKEPIRLNYILILGFVTLMVIFTAIWFSLKISNSITVPIKQLALATEEVKSGNLDTHVNIKSDDEIGMLIDSFNRMVVQLKENKRSIEIAYKETERQRLHLDKIMENIKSGVIFLNRDGSINTINRAAKVMLRIKTDVRGEHYSKILQALGSEDVNNLVKDLQGKGFRSVQREVKIPVGSMTYIYNVYISDIVEPTTSENLGILVVFDDMTEFVRAQKAIAWQEVAMKMAHEIKNPLTPIKLSAERLLKKWQKSDTDLDNIFERSIKTIINEVEALRQMCDEFSRYGRLPEIQKTKTNINELLNEVASLYKGFKEINININADDTIEANIDINQIKRAIINIVDNAIKAMNQSGSIDISCTSLDKTIVIDIADKGEGIKAEDREMLFLPYFSRRKDGTGLGLAISHRIVREHGGKIHIKDNVPKGTIFSIELPVS